MEPMQFHGAVNLLLDDDLQARCAGIIDLTRWHTGGDCAALTVIDAPGTRPAVVAAHEYPPDVADALTSEPFMDCRELRWQLAEQKTVNAWEDVGFADSQFAQEVLIPQGFRNGMSLPLRGPSGTLVGMLHVSTTRPVFDRDAKGLLLAIRPGLTELTLAVREDRRASLTAREREVLKLVRDGMSNHEIAGLMHIAERTVATHIEHILHKTGTRNRVAAAVWALRHYG